MLTEYINLIRDEKLKQICQYIISQDYSKWCMAQPSSSSGKYHPKDEIVQYGQTIHIMKAVVMALLAARQYHKAIINIDRYYIDKIIATVLLHDLPKKFYFCQELNKVRCNLYHHRDNAMFFEEVARYMQLNENDIFEISSAIVFHSGKWDDRNDSYCITKKPGILGEIMHNADYFSSRAQVQVEYSIEICKELMVDILNSRI